MNQDEYAILREVWLKAARGEKVELTFPSKGRAQYARMRLYKAVRPVRENPGRDPELNSAINRCMVSWTGEASFRVEVTSQSDLSLAGEIAKAIGFDPQAEIERKAQEMLKKFSEGPGSQESASPAGRSTKYFTRDEG